MKKTLIAIAALAATAAFAQSTTVTMYGRAHLAFDNLSATTNTAATTLNGRQRVSDDGSRIGLSINEDLGGGLRAFSIIETGVNLDTATANGQSGAANTGTGFFGTREAHLGLGNKTAEVRLGRQNVYWGNGAIEDTGANRVHGGVFSVYTAQSSGWVTAPVARQDNTVQFLAGSDMGAFAGSSYWFSAGAAATAEGAALGTNPQGKASGLTVKYTSGPIAVQFDQSENKSIAANINNVNVAADFVAKGTKLGAAYTYAAGSKVALSVFSMSREYSLAATNTAALAIADTAVGGRKQGGWALGVNHNLGAGYEGIVQYVKQGDVSAQGAVTTLADSGSTAYAFALRKDLSARTSLSTSYNIINNGANNNIQASGGGQAAVAAVGFGAKVRLFGVAMQHNF